MNLNPPSGAIWSAERRAQGSRTPPDVMPTQVAKFIEQNLGKPPYYFSIKYFGIARDTRTGRVYFDLYEQCANLEYAKSLAKDEAETCIIDVANETEINVEL
jgi:hypothetical protein